VLNNLRKERAGEVLLLWHGSVNRGIILKKNWLLGISSEIFIEASYIKSKPGSKFNFDG